LAIAIKIFNGFILLLIYGLIGFLSYAFYVGTEESHQKLVNEMPWSFVLRFSVSVFMGICLIVLLVLINYLVNSTILKHQGKTNLKKLAINGILIMTVIAFIGTAYFFYN